MCRCSITISSLAACNLLSLADCRKAWCHTCVVAPFHKRLHFIDTDGLETCILRPDAPILPHNSCMRKLAAVGERYEEVIIHVSLPRHVCKADSLQHTCRILNA